jgi:hypothetical protein
MEMPVDCLAGVEFDKSQVVINGTRLSVRGWKCDAVIDVGPLSFLSEIEEAVNDSHYIEFADACLRFLPRLDPLYINGQSAAETLALASCGPCIDEERKLTVPKSFSTMMAANLAKYRAHLTNSEIGRFTGEGQAAAKRCLGALEEMPPTKGLPSMSFIRELTTWVLEQQDGEPDSRSEEVAQAEYEFNACNNRALTERRFFLGESKLLGIGPMSLRSDDEIWMISGSPVPMALRPSWRKGEYTVVGETYVHGAMQGELAPYALSEGLQNITLV